MAAPSGRLMPDAPKSAAGQVLVIGGPRLAARASAVSGLVTELAAGISGLTGDRAAGVIASGGKRLRPLLALLLAGDHELDPAAELSLRTAAAAIELVHVATLVHDDVLDRAALRRGVTTVWSADGAPAATGAGDALLAAAFAAVAADAIAPVAQVLATAASSLAAGELMQRADAYRLDITPERYEARVIGKTAALFDAACRIGALHGDLDPDRAGAIGEDLGFAFQLLDDVLDVEGDSAVTGKRRGTDLLDGTVTLPLTIAARRDPALAELDLRALDPAAAVRVCDQIIATGATDTVRALGLERIDRVQQAIAALPGSSARREALALAARSLVDRSA